MSYHSFSFRSRSFRGDLQIVEVVRATAIHWVICDSNAGFATRFTIS